MLKRAYIEITNVCNLRCSFCPGTGREKDFMPPERFRLLAEKLRGHVKYLYLHVMGEPLLHPRLGELLAIAADLGFRTCLTTNGTLLGERGDAVLAARGVHKVSVSLHSAEGNGMGELTEYLSSVWDFSRRASETGIICALRLWNLGGAEARNLEILTFLAERLGAWPLELPQPRRGSWKLGERLYLEQAERFDWPDMEAAETGTRFCLGLREQIAVLCDGTAAPCCLDHEGDVPLGNLLEQSLEEILAGPRARALVRGFSEGRPSEELCRRCGFATRFG